MALSGRVRRVVPITRTLLGLLVPALLAGCGSISPPPLTSSAPPSPRREAQTELPLPIREVMPNGLRLIIQDQRAAPVAAVYLWVAVGIRDEQPDQLGYSHFQEHMLFKGTDRWGPGHTDRIVEVTGSSRASA
jgi:Insulinase (Peptidase family M16)